MNNTATSPFATEYPAIKGIDCSTCYDTGTIDHAGSEIKCEHCADYRPSAVTVERYTGQISGWTPQGTEYIVIDSSRQGPVEVYATGSRQHCEDRAAKRRAVIKATITRRANKAKAQA